MLHPSHSLRRSMRLGLGSALLLSGALLTGCDRGLPNQPAEELPREAGIHPLTAVVGSTAEAVQVELRLVRVGVSEGIASYQGELAFDSLHARLLDVTFPSSAVADWRLLDGGHARFSVAQPGGLADSVAATFSFRPTGSKLDPRSLHVRLDEVTAAGDDFKDLTPQVVQKP